MQDVLVLGDLKLAKDKSTERIDGIVAAIMAIGRAIVAQDEPQPLYQVSGILYLSGVWHARRWTLGRWGRLS